MAPTLKKVVEAVTLGEGPHWAHEEQVLYFVSTYDRSIHRYDPATGAHTSCEMDGRTAFIIPIEGKRHHFAVGVERRLLEVHWGGADDAAAVLRTIAEVDLDNPTNRFNDAKADPRGRLFAGTMGGEYAPGKFHLKKGSLYRIDPDGSPHVLDSGIDISNGLCWDVDNKAFYFADSFEYAVRRYDYDIETGNISNPKLVFVYKEHGLHGIPDGMTIDTEGNLWLANFDNYLVLKIDPSTGTLLDKIKMPALQVTSVTFGGPSHDELYVTTARVDRGAPQPPPAGCTFKLTGLGVKGTENLNVRLN
ncbi:regucalcin-like [Plodia interpunctella]|uniref:regucalcin-like n=1 Tax=Plodia interpunctella TaxID=58824 RepID=UPI002367C25C|nr:regucalcin-like [Plodia interpunctella]XP_053604623.1 regucalcin-like [Plodia interpunctella]XP_053604624.1 regucalcin-like [Plodia interpunctella]XP_053604625.1 regucalcin-like [Plodia interpunctella]XP_053604626.1 regucalcin-like [Plodia interpunctella]